MSTTTDTSIKLTLGYDNTDFTRTMSMSVDDSITAATVKQKIWDINDSISGGTADDLKNFLLADDYDGTNGRFAGITAAQINTIEETTIF